MGKSNTISRRGFLGVLSAISAVKALPITFKKEKTEPIKMRDGIKPPDTYTKGPKFNAEYYSTTQAVLCNGYHISYVATVMDHNGGV